MKFPLIRSLLPVFLLALGAFAAQNFLNGRPEAERKAPDVVLPIVELVTLKPEARTATLSGTGIVTPAHELNLSPQLSGQVTYVSPGLVPGGRVKKGELLVRIDAREHQLTVAQRRSALRSAGLQIEQEKARQALASHEWQALGESGPASPLFSRDSQLATAQANLDSGSSALQQAELTLERASLRAPFDATVIRKSVDIGQVVTPGLALAYLVGTEKTWVVVSVRLDELSLLSIPGVGPAAPASRAAIRQRLAHGGAIERTGTVTRLIGQLDAQTRRAQVLTTIEDALSTSQGLPLLPGALVTVAMTGKPFEEVYPIARHAVYNGNQVWIANNQWPPRQPSGSKLSENGNPKTRHLERRTIQIAWGDDEFVFATSGVSSGDQLVMTRLASPLNGMAVQSLAEARTKQKQPTREPSGAQPSTIAGDTTSDNERPPESIR